MIYAGGLLFALGKVSLCRVGYGYCLTHQSVESECVIPIHEMLDTNLFLLPPYQGGLGGSMCSTLKVKWYYATLSHSTGVAQLN